MGMILNELYDLLFLCSICVLQPKKNLVRGEPKLGRVIHGIELRDGSLFQKAMDAIRNDLLVEADFPPDFRGALPRVHVELVENLPILQIELELLFGSHIHLFSYFLFKFICFDRKNHNKFIIKIVTPKLLSIGEKMRTVNLTRRTEGNVVLHDLFEGGLETQVLTEHRPEPAEHASFTVPGLILDAGINVDTSQAFNDLNGQYHYWSWRTHRESEGALKLARSLVIPMRYVVLEGEKDTHVIVSDRLDKIIEKVKSLDDLRNTEFHYTYPKMVPANTVVKVAFDLGEGEAKYRNAKAVRYIEPIPQPADIRAIGEAYGDAVFRAIRGFMSQVPQGEEIGIGLSGGADSGLVYMLANKALQELGRDPQALRAFTLKIGEGGKDVAQARRLVELLQDKGFETRQQWEVLAISPDALPTLEQAVSMMEDYKTTHDLQDVMVSMAFKKALRERYPNLRFMLDGQGGDELCQDYNVEETGVTLQEVLANPHLYVEGRIHLPGRVSEMFSGGLSRRVTRDYAPSAAYGFQGFSPICSMEVNRVAYGTPKPELSGGIEAGLYDLKIAFADAAAESVMGFSYSFPQKNRFQVGASDATTFSSKLATIDEGEARMLFNERMESLMRVK